MMAVIVGIMLSLVSVTAYRLHPFTQEAVLTRAETVYTGKRIHTSDAPLKKSMLTRGEAVLGAVRKEEPITPFLVVEAAASMDAYDEMVSALPAGSSVEARARLDLIGRDLEAAYRWTSSLVWTGEYKSADPGTRFLAHTGFTTGTGSCYVMAACFYEMARDLGYEAYHMSGLVPLAIGGLGPHSWVEVVIDGVTYVVDPDFASETGRSGYLIYYGQPGTWLYQSYYRMNG